MGRVGVWIMCVYDNEDRECGVVYYESLKREVKTKPINECRCDERLKTRVEECKESTRLT